MSYHKKPSLTVDIFIFNDKKEFILIKRKNNPYKDCWAFPGGFVDYGETTEDAAVREAKEETSIDVDLQNQFKVYSNPLRDPRGHTITVVYLAKGNMNDMKADDDAKGIEIFSYEDLKDMNLAFDHKQILEDIFNSLN
ncbi:MAG: NUDIX hydrolase [Methanobacteriaceae archaeon]|jgi:8-oxo-dGTP diphosphatase|nr:NUDIX hydrolase [Methanobacteriaceae archaeon]